MTAVRTFAPGDYRLVGTPERVLMTVIDAHKAGQLKAVTRPTRHHPDRVATQIRIGRPRSSRRVRVAAIVALVMTVLVALFAAGAVAAQWAVANGAALMGLSALVRGMVWLHQRQGTDA